MGLREKYKGHRVRRYDVVAGSCRSGGVEVVCSLCGMPYRDNISGDAVEVVCSSCTMGMADAYDPSKAFSQSELVKAISERKLKQFRVKYGLTQADLSRLIGISSRQLRNHENAQYIPIDGLVKKVSEMGDEFLSSDSYP